MLHGQNQNIETDDITPSWRQEGRCRHGNITPNMNSAINHDQATISEDKKKHRRNFMIIDSILCILLNLFHEKQYLKKKDLSHAEAWEQH